MTARLAPLLLALFLMIPTASQAGRRTPDVVEDARAFALTDRDKAIQLLEDAIADRPSAKDLDPITVNAGEQRRLAGDSDQAHKWFTTVLSHTEKGADAESARLGLALLQSGEGMKPRTRTILADVSDKNALDTQNADRYYLLAIAAAADGNASEHESYAAKARQYATEDPAVFARIDAALKAVAAGEEPPPPTGATTAGSRKGGKLDKADAALDAGRKDEARRLASDVANSSADPKLVRAANYLLQRIDGAAVNSRKVAVLLPLDGKYGAVGKQVQEALQFGHREAGAPFSLVFMDSGATPESAVRALEDAVLRDGAIAVVGPLLTDETDAVVEAAEALRVPLLSLSQSLEDVGDSQWVLQAMMAPGDQIRALLDQVMGVDKMDAFAVFAPQNSYGERVVEQFTSEVVARNGKVTVSQFYDPTANDLIEFAKSLGRKDYKARAHEYYELKQQTEEKGGNPDRVVLPPIVDFDAIFLPDSASRVPLACAALAYEEFPMGDFFPTKDSPFLPLLGLSGWNNAGLVSTGGPYARRSYFPDAFLGESTAEEPAWTQSERQAAFVTAYKAQTRRTPTALEALVVDAGKLLAAASKSSPTTRSEMLAALLAAEPKDPVAGTHGIDAETHRARRDLLILSISEDAIVPRSELPPTTTER